MRECRVRNLVRWLLLRLPADAELEFLEATPIGLDDRLFLLSELYNH